MTDLYIGIDPGVKNLALVVWSPSRGIVLSAKPPAKEIEPGVRRLSFLMQFIKSNLAIVESRQDRVKHIAIEGYSMFERFGQHAAGEVGGAIKLSLVSWFGLGNPTGYPTIVTPQQLKKFTTGSGAAKKSVMVKEVLKRWEADFNDENLAEAYALARVAYAVHVEPEMMAFQREVTKALKGRSEWNPGWFKTEPTDGKSKPTTVSSASPGRTIRRTSPGSSPTPSSRAKKSNSAPSGPRRLIRPSRPQPSADSTSPATASSSAPPSRT